MPTNPHQEWQDLVAPWRAAAEGLGFRLLDRTVALQRDRTHDCTDYLVDQEGRFLDLAGVLGREQGRAHGFWSAGFNSWLEDEGKRAHVYSVGEKDPAPRPPDGVGRFVASLLTPLMKRLLPAPLRPLPMRAPGDLAAVLRRHTELCALRPGKLVRFEGDRLAARFAQARRDAGLEEPTVQEPPNTLQ